MTDVGGQAVAGAKITLYSRHRPGFGDRSSDKLREVYTGPRGFFRMTLGRPMKALLTVDASGYERLKDIVDLNQTDHVKKDYVVSKAADLVWGIVREAGSGKRLSGVSVGLSFPVHGPTPVGWVYSRATKSDSVGKYSFTRVRTGWDFSLLADDSEHLVVRTKAHLEPGAQELRVDLDLTPSKSVLVKVVNGSGVPIPEAQIAVAFLRTTPAFTNDHGLARVEVEAETPAESVNCRVVADGYLDREVEISLDAGPAEVVLRPGPLVEGLVLDESGRRLEGANVLIKSGSSGHRTQSGSSDEKGLFAIRLRKLPLKSIRVGHPDFLSKKILFDEGAPLEFMTIELESGAGSIGGRVVSEEGDPLTQFDVGVTRRASDIHAEGHLRRSVQDPLGRFKLDDLPDGTYDLGVSWRNPDDKDHFQLGSIRGIEIQGGTKITDLLLQVRTQRFRR